MNPYWQLAFVTMSILVIAAVLLLVGILRYLARIQDQIDLVAPQVTAFERGDKLTPFQLPMLDGGSFALADLLQRKRAAVLLLVTPSCHSCAMIIDQLKELANRESPWNAAADAVVIAGGNLSDETHAELASLRNAGVLVLVDSAGEAFSTFGIRSVPTGFTVDVSGSVTSQSWNPHASNWLYRQLGVDPPKRAVSLGYGSLMLPATELALQRSASGASVTNHQEEGNERTG